MNFPEWTTRAICPEIDPAAYFPDKGAAPGSALRAKRLCNTRCPVREECLEWALSFEVHNPNTAFGVFGGMSARERKVLLGRRSA